MLVIRVITYDGNCDGMTEVLCVLLRLDKEFRALYAVTLLDVGNAAQDAAEFVGRWHLEGCAGTLLDGEQDGTIVINETPQVVFPWVTEA